MINWKCNSCDGIYESLDIRFTKACDNNCSFCIEKFGIKSLGKTDVAALAKSVFDSDFKNILIVGGEPLLDLQKLYQFVHLVRSYTKVKKIYVTTSLPISIDINLDTKNLLIDIIKLIDGLNVSLQHKNMDLKEHIVGEVEGYPVIYIEEKDTIFCKNTAVKYSLLKRLYDSPFSREKIEEKSLTITKEEHFVTFGCLTTTKEYCQTVIKNINKIKNGESCRS